jgi:hypothetical protein
MLEAGEVAWVEFRISASQLSTNDFFSLRAIDMFLKAQYETKPSAMVRTNAMAIILLVFQAIIINV